MATTTITFTDYSDERSNVTYNVEDFNEVNWVTLETEMGALSLATNALSIGHLSRRSIGMTVINSPDVPANVYAQRELKWLVSYRGVTTGKQFQVEIPCANLTGNLVPGTDIADLTSTSWVNYIAAFNTVVRSPDDSAEQAEFVGARLVGRNL